MRSLFNILIKIYFYLKISLIKIIYIFRINLFYGLFKGFLITLIQLIIKYRLLLKLISVIRFSIVCSILLFNLTYLIFMYFSSMKLNFIFLYYSESILEYFLVFGGLLWALWNEILKYKTEKFIYIYLSIITSVYCISFLRNFLKLTNYFYMFFT